MTTRPPIDQVILRIKAVIEDAASRARVLAKAGKELAALAAVYPIEGGYNREPGTNKWGTWYQRGFGTRWRNKSGFLTGNNNSQDLQKSWQVEQRDFSASIYTYVTYAPFLLDPDNRVSWAAPHGWETDQEIADGFAPRFEEIALDEIDKQIEKI